MMRIFHGCRGFQRATLALLVLLAFTCLQTAAAIADHPHNHGKDSSHCCAACHAGHLGLIQPAGDLSIYPPAASEPRLWVQESCAVFDYLGIPSPSRAPPA